MKALVYTGTNASEIRNVAAPVAADGQSVIDLSFCGICGPTCMRGMGMMNGAFRRWSLAMRLWEPR